MWSIVSFSVSFIIAVVIVVVSAVRGYEILLYFSFVFFTYSIGGFLFYVARDDADTERSKWMTAKSESELLKSGATVDIGTVVEFKKDIDDVNRMIARSRRFEGHWFCGTFVNPETAKLETIGYDTVNVNIILE